MSNHYKLRAKVDYFELLSFMSAIYRFIQRMQSFHLSYYSLLAISKNILKCVKRNSETKLFWHKIYWPNPPLIDNEQKTNKWYGVKCKLIGKLFWCFTWLSSFLFEISVLEKEKIKKTLTKFGHKTWKLR